MRINIKKLKKDKALTVEQLAGKAAMRENLIYKIQAGTTNPSMTTIERLARGVKMNAKDFINEYGI